MNMSESLEVRSLGYLIESGVIDAVNGFPFGGHNENGAGVPHIRPFNVTTSGEISLAQIKSIPAEAANGKPRLRRGDIVFNNTNTKELVGKCAVWEDDAEPVFSNHMTRIRVHDASCDAAYLSFAILHHWMIGRSEMLARAHVAQASIMGERFREIEVPWPSPAQQRAIAMLLTRVRNSCQLDVKQEEAARRLKAAAMRVLFTRGLRGELQKDTEIGPVPESWEIVGLGTCVQRPDYGFTASAQQAKLGPKFLRITDIQDGSVDWETVPYCVIDKDTLVQKRLGDGDIVVARIGATTGKAFYIQNVPEAVFASYMIRLRALPEKLLPKFLYYFMQSDAYWSHIEQNKGGRLKGGINIPILSSMPVGRPKDINEQREIVAILDAIDRKIDLHRRKKQVLEELFKALLHKLMTGEIHVADLDLSALESASESASTAAEAAV